MDVAALKNKIVRKVNEYQKKLRLGKQIKQIVQKVNEPKACLDKENMEAMELYENHGLCWVRYMKKDEVKQRQKEWWGAYMKKDEKSRGRGVILRNTL